MRCPVHTAQECTCTQALTRRDVELFLQSCPVSSATGSVGEAKESGVALVVDLEVVLVEFEGGDDSLVVALGERARRGAGAGAGLWWHGGDEVFGVVR